MVALSKATCVRSLVVVDILGHQPFQMKLVQYNDMIEQVSGDCRPGVRASRLLAFACGFHRRCSRNRAFKSLTDVAVSTDFNNNVDSESLGDRDVSMILFECGDLLWEQRVGFLVLETSDRKRL
jgi:hypothetical protein